MHLTDELTLDLGHLFQQAGEWLRWAENPHEGSDFVGRADNVLPLRHKGWYVDADLSDVQFGVVRLVEHNQIGRYIACVSDPHNGEKSGKGPCLVLCREDGSPELFDTAEEAACAADNTARITAEAMFEHNERWHERNTAEEAFSDCVSRRKEILSRARNILRGMRDSQSITAGLRDTLLAVIREHREGAARLLPVMREAKETMERLKDYR